MLLLSGRRILICGINSVLRNHHATKHVLDGVVAKRSGYDPSNVPGIYRHISARDVVFSPSNMYSKKKNQTEKLRIVDLVLTKAQPGAAGAVVVNGWHTSGSEERIHCTVDYTDTDNRRIMRDHIFPEPTKKA
ncbi:hypothetical protein ACHAPO_012073 [Fusarium lateritium]